MKFVVVQFHNSHNHSGVFGKVRIPDDFDPNWHLGFMKYLQDTYGAQSIHIYPLNERVNQEMSGYNNSGYEDLTSDLDAAIKSTRYYKDGPTSDHIRTQWHSLDLI